jgi:hypothetical protein
MVVQKPRVIIFMSNLPLQALYLKWIRSHLAERVGFHFPAETPEVFEDITTNSAGTWSVLVTDVGAEGNYRDVLQRFAAANPQVTTVVLAQRGVTASSSLPNARVLAYPQDIDEFLAMMYGLV